MICPVCKQDTYIASGCNKCLKCSIDALNRMLEKNQDLKNAFKEAVEATKQHIPKMVADTMQFCNSLKHAQDGDLNG